MKLKDITPVNILLPVKVLNGMGIVDISGKVWMSEQTYNEFKKQGKIRYVSDECGGILDVGVWMYIRDYSRSMEVGILEDDDDNDSEQ